MKKELQQSEHIDQIGLVLRAVRDPRERAEFLFDPHRYAAKKGVRFDPGFVDALQVEVSNINKKLFELEDQQGISLPRINDPRALSELGAGSFSSKIGEVAILPAVVAVAEVVSAVAIVVIAVTEVYQATKFVKSAMTSSR